MTTKPHDEEPGNGASIRLPAGVRDYPSAPRARLTAHAGRWDFTTILDLKRVSATELAAFKADELPEVEQWRA